MNHGKGDFGSKANDTQVGGSHYKTGYEHWDLVLRTNMMYLEGQATKYVSRWRKKNGVEDLKKAEHYVQKLIENAPLCLALRRRPFSDRIVVSEVTKFARVNALSSQEESFVRTMGIWQTVEQLEEALDLITALRGEAEAKPVPLEDTNKHGDRFENTVNFAKPEDRT